MVANIKATTISVTAAFVALVACLPITGPACKKSGDEIINGAGSTFAYPLYSKWAHAYQHKTAVKINYQSIGSGGGIAQVKAGTIDFGASDAPLSLTELQKYGLVQFPMMIGGVAIVINLPNVESGKLRLSKELLAQIFLGQITKWNHAQIKALNPQIYLPMLDITVVHRADGSGTTWIFTDYLSKISDQWKQKVGRGKQVAWPVGVGGKGNEGIAAYVQKVKGAIGYVEYAYALENKMTTVLLENKQGQYVSPDYEAFKAAAAQADWEGARDKGLYMVLTDQPGLNTWPIVGATFNLVKVEQKNPALAKRMLDFFHWCYEEGDELARQLHYVPVPSTVVQIVETLWADKIRAQGKTVWQLSKAADRSD